jgi:dienelactone hydrolase
MIDFTGFLRGRLLPIGLLCHLGLAVVAGPAVGQSDSDPWLEQPVTDDAFAGYLEFFAYDTDLPLEVATLERSESQGIEVERIRYVSTPGVEVYAEYLRTARSDPRSRPHIVLVHGGVQSGKTSMRPIAELFVRSGVNVLSIDLLYFGERDTGVLTSFSEDDKHQNLYNRPPFYLSWVVQTVKDVGRAIDLLVSHYKADPESIGYVGFSRGAQVGFIVAAAETRFNAVALMYGGHLDRFETGHLAAACPANYAGRIAPTPLWVLNGSFDSDYDKQKSVEPLHRLLREPVQIRWVDTGHQYPEQSDLTELAGWLRDQIGR